jgi:hypothetical protein
MNEREPAEPVWPKRLKYLGATAVTLGVAIITGNQLSGLESPILGALGALSVTGGPLVAGFGFIGDGINEACRSA